MSRRLVNVRTASAIATAGFIGATYCVCMEILMPRPVIEIEFDQRSKKRILSEAASVNVFLRNAGHPPMYITKAMLRVDGKESDSLNTSIGKSVKEEGYSFFTACEVRGILHHQEMVGRYPIILFRVSYNKDEKTIDAFEHHFYDFLRRKDVQLELEVTPTDKWPGSVLLKRKHVLKFVS